MENILKREIDAIVRSNHITREDIEMDLDTRENYPGEFYLMPLAHVATDELREYCEAMP